MDELAFSGQIDLSGIVSRVVAFVDNEPIARASSQLHYVGQLRKKRLGWIARRADREQLTAGEVVKSMLAQRGVAPVRGRILSVQMEDHFRFGAGEGITVSVPD